MQRLTISSLKEKSTMNYLITSLKFDKPCNFALAIGSLKGQKRLLKREHVMQTVRCLLFSMKFSHKQFQNCLQLPEGPKEAFEKRLHIHIAHCVMFAVHCEVQPQASSYSPAAL